jgi:tetratricopeptide (TPR) repeat protein
MVCMVQDRQIDKPGSYRVPAGHVAQIEEFNVLRDLPIHPDVSGHLSEYFPGSRADDARYILQWLESDQPSELVLCVLGKVGVGKSTLAKHLATRLRQDKRLAANIFLGFALPDWSAEMVVRMAAGQMCGAFPALTRLVCEAIRLDVDPSLPLETRIQKLIVEPIQTLGLHYPLVILLDALDQWAPHTVFIKALAYLTTQTHLVKFVVFGRPGLEGRFQTISMRRYDLSDVTQSVMRKYFRQRLDQIEWPYGNKPSTQIIDQLADRANGLFIWSSTVCSVLEDELSCPNPQDTLTAILRSERSVDDDHILASLYYSAIQLQFPKPDHKAKVRVVLGALLVLQEPLPITAFASLVSMTIPTIRKILGDLRSLRTEKLGDDRETVYPATLLFHLSFLDYLQSLETPPVLAFPIDTFTSHAQLGKVCLEELRQFSSSPPSTFTTPLQKYATRYWPTHTARGTPSVTPTSDSEWKATPHSTILDSLSITQWHRWGISYLQLCRPGTVLGLIDPAHIARNAGAPNRSHGSDYFISCLVAVSGDPPVAADTTDATALGKVAIALEHRSSDAWLVLGRAYEYAAHTATDPNLLDSAVQACRFAVDLGGRREHWKALLMLAKCLHQRFVRFGAMEDLEEAITLEKAVVLATPPSHPDHAPSLNNLATTLHIRHQHIGSIKSLEESIVVLQQALLLWPSEHPELYPVCSSNLANSLQSHFEATGVVESLNRAIVLFREALLLMPPNGPRRAITLSSLANSLQSHYDSTGVIESLDQAISLNRESLTLLSPTHHSRSLALNNLASALCSRLERTGNSENIEEATSLYREALSLRPSGHSYHALSLNNLANCLHSCSKITSSLPSLEEAIVLFRQTLLLRPAGHPHHALSVRNLAYALQTHFEQTGTVESIEESIALYREAMLLCSPGHPSYTILRDSLTSSLHALYKSTGDTQISEEATPLAPLDMGTVD